MQLDQDFLQPIELIKRIDDELSQPIICKIVYYRSEKFHDCEFSEKYLSDLKSYIQKFENIILKQYGTSNPSDVRVFIDKEHKKMYYLNLNSEKVEIVPNNFMWFEIHLEAAYNSLYECLDAKLTKVGINQFNMLENQLKSLSKVCQTSQNIYAPFTSLIQSSGFGKTKMCLELLKKYPGVYLVFRRITDTGIPRMAPYMKDLMNFVVEAPKDELPMEKSDIDAQKAYDYTSGRFLIALYTLMEAYKKLLLETIEKIRSERPGQGNEREIVAEAIKCLGENYMFETGDKKIYNLEVNFSTYQFLSFNNLTTKIFHLCKEITETVNKSRPSNSNNPQDDFPFLVFLDEADVLNKSNLPGKILGINIVRRALHLLNQTTSLMTLAIGTNCDALDFSPSVNDDSLRVPTRNISLPPITLSGNWDIFNDKLDFKNLTLGRKELLNRAFFNLHVTMGRAMWSSFTLGEIMSIAMKKLKNGDRDSIGSLVAPLLVRANIDVNVNHILARNLIKSYMIVVNYVSSDAKNLKIGYSSEPILSFAARALLMDKSEREKSFRALKKMLEDKAIDKGRIVEVIFEHMSLFAIDDVKMNSEPLEFSTEVQPELPDSIKNIIQKTSFILDEKKKDANASYESERNTHYRVVSVQQYFSKLLKKELFLDHIKPMLHKSVLNGLVNVSHFIQLEQLLGDDFKGFYDEKVLVKLMKKVLDRSILKCGLLRTFGVVMPPNYTGIDFILPFLIDNPDKKFTRPLYSFIAFQSKASATNTADCAYKMAASLHLINCPHADHQTPQDCLKNNCDAGFTQAEIEEICANQVVVLLSAKNDEYISDLKGKINVSLKGRKYVGTSKSRVDKEKKSILKDCKIRYEEHILQAQSSPKDLELSKSEGSEVKKSQHTEHNRGLRKSQGPKMRKSQLATHNRGLRKSQRIAKNLCPFLYKRISKNCKSRNVDQVKSENKVKVPVPVLPISYPVFSKAADFETPDFILTKFINSQLKVQKMVWDGGSRDDKYVGKVSKDLDTGTRSVRKKKLDFLKTSGPRTLTCIDIHDIWAFDHLVSKNSIAVILEIMSMVNSNFHSVEPVNLPVVQNSMVNGKFCPYHACNPQLNKMRGLPLLSGPTPKYTSEVFESKWLSAIEACIDGPVNSKLDPPVLLDNYADTFEKIHDMDIDDSKSCDKQESVDEKEYIYEEEQQLMDVFDEEHQYYMDIIDEEQESSPYMDVIDEEFSDMKL